MLTQERLKEVLSYNPETGVFIRTARPLNNKGRVGDTVGSNNGEGYLKISINKSNHKLHRLAFLYMEGYFPEYSVDHINGVKDDNRWCNLRHVSPVCNSQNQKIRNTNTSGYSGVSWHKQRKKWVARIMINGKQIPLGCHATAIDAALARIAAEDCHPDWHCDERCENRKKVFADLITGPAV